MVLYSEGESNLLVCVSAERVPGSAKKRGLGRTLALNLVPKRITPTAATPGRPRRPVPPPFDGCRSERKDPMINPMIHRQSISERKAVPLIDGRVGHHMSQRSFLPKPVKPTNGDGGGAGARKELKFNQGWIFCHHAKNTKKIWRLTPLHNLLWQAFFCAHLRLRLKLSFCTFYLNFWKVYLVTWIVNPAKLAFFF